jgi:hypothetical protein
MQFQIAALGGAIHTSLGTNMIEPFPAGTQLMAYSVNGQWFNATKPVFCEEGVEFLLIELSDIRDAIRRGAPRLFRPGLVPAGPPDVA